MPPVFQRVGLLGPSLCTQSRYEGARTSHELALMAHHAALKIRLLPKVPSCLGRTALGGRGTCRLATFSATHEVVMDAMPAGVGLAISSGIASGFAEDEMEDAEEELREREDGSKSSEEIEDEEEDDEVRDRLKRTVGPLASKRGVGGGRRGMSFG
ncbi:hypothetical protein DL93DRAFT_2102102 [Clavulina sp. PMI_390]|nr:hypothetical protein DL93DRAFT_2102102 [Clavulina sp. PMI_390]